MKTKRRTAEGSTAHVDASNVKSLTRLYYDCMEHVEDVMRDAEILLSKRRYSRAFYLASIAYEELGKSQLVGDFINGSASRREFQDGFRDHEAKLAYADRSVRHHRNSMGEGSEEIEYDTKSTKWWIEYRNAALYLSFKSGYVARVVNPRIMRKLALVQVDVVNSVIRAIRKAEDQCDYIGTRALQWTGADYLLARD